MTTESSRAEPGILVATSAFATTVDGQKYVIRRGDTVRDGHPLLKDGRDVFFQPFTVAYELPAAKKPSRPKKAE